MSAAAFIADLLQQARALEPELGAKEVTGDPVEDAHGHAGRKFAGEIAAAVRSGKAPEHFLYVAAMTMNGMRNEGLMLGFLAGLQAELAKTKGGRR